MKTELQRQSLLSCVHCGLCLDACPTYRVTRLEPDSPRGRIYLMRALEEGRIEASEDVIEHLDLCLECRACETACPAGVHYGDLIERTRARLHESGHGGLSGRVAALVMNRLFHPRERVELAIDGLRALQRLGLFRLAASPAMARWLPETLRAAVELLPAVPSRSVRALPVGVHRALPPYQAKPKARVGLFATCVVQPLYPDVNRALLRLLRLAGCEVVVPAGQTCCGSLHVHAGYREQARTQARVNLEAFPEDLDYIALASAGCGATLKEYPGLFTESGEAALGRRVERLSARVRDGLELLADLGLPPPTRAVPERIAVHDPCHLAHAQKVRQAPRELLRKLDGAEVVDLANSDYCCGSAGIYNLKHPEMAGELLEQKLATVRQASPTVVAVANPGCLLYMAAGARRERMTTRFVHPLEILSRGYPQNDRAVGALPCPCP